MNHLQAKQIVDRALPSLSQPESLVVRGVSDLETSYGEWGSDPARGAGSNNMGAITDSTYRQGDPPNSWQFLHTDTRPWTESDGGTIPPDGEIHYSTAFVKYPTPDAGFRAVAVLTALKPNVRAAIASGSIRGVSAAMRANKYYFGVHPTKAERFAGMTTAQGVEKNIDDHAKRLAQCIANIVAATGEPNPFTGLQQNQELKAGSPLACGSQSSPLEGSFSTLRLGAKGPDVVRWQGLIGAKPDGSFGLVTESLTRAKQLSLGLTPDGVVGPLTWKAALGQEA